MSRTANRVADSVLATFSGRTVTLDAILDQIALEYAVTGKRRPLAAYDVTMDALAARGVAPCYRWAAVDSRLYYTFPAG